MIKEAVANTLKHANASKIDITISLVDNIFNFSISDNGKNFSPMVSDGGRGLHNMRERIGLLHGNVKFNSNAKGTTISGSFPMANVNIANEI